MMRELGISIKMLKHGFQAKMQMGMMVLFLIIGLTIELGTKGTYWMGAMFVMITPMYFAQLIYGLGLSQMVTVSPHNRRFQTGVPAMGSAILSTICFTILVLVKCWEINKHPELTDIIMLGLFITGAISLVFNVYTAVVYKYYAVSLIIMCISVGGISGSYGFLTGMGREIRLPLVSNLSVGGVILLSYVLVLAGALLQYVISCALYRKPLSEYAQGAMMRKYLKG